MPVLHLVRREPVTAKRPLKGLDLRNRRNEEIREVRHTCTPINAEAAAGVHRDTSRSAFALFRPVFRLRFDSSAASVSSFTERSGAPANHDIRLTRGRRAIGRTPPANQEWAQECRLENHMKTRMHAYTTSILGVAVLTMTMGSSLTTYADAEGEQGGRAARDRDVVVTKGRSERRLSPSEIAGLRAMTNPLESPDTTFVAPDTDAGPNSKGANTKAGIIAGTRSGMEAFGSFGIPYTTTRVQDGNQSAAGATSANRLSTTYPYRTVGKLTFSAGYCSASLIRRSVIVTAAHCIQNFGTGSNIFSGFQFRPGHYGAVGATAAQIAPYGTWNWIRLVRPASWANGTDVGTGAARDNDLAVIALGKNAAGQFVGDLVGYMGYGWNNYSFVTSSKTGNLHTAAVSTLGYPALMDGGRIMQRTDGPSYTTVLGGAGQLWQGSNFTGGSSGGPWVVNFASRNAVLSGGAVRGTASTIAVIGVTSWGAADPNAPKDNWSSQFRQNSRYPNAAYGIYGAGNIGSLLNTLCAAAAPEGGTLASRGYCN
jgi:V8-like Glu-specific endopeptidase